MPVATRIDHEERRRAVARATWDVIRRKGLDRTGIRDIADELGSTASVVTHYFRTRDELIRFACHEVFAAYRSQMFARGGAATGLEWLEQALLGGLPVAPRRELGWEVWVAFLGHAIGRPEMLVEEAERQAALRVLLIGELGRLQDNGDIPRGCDLGLEADLLAAVIDGLGIGRVVQPKRYGPKRVKALFRSYLVSRLGYWPRARNE
ncbi:MAG: TetR/AcrR family transcriptional regulator [Gemmatimonadota bacterium]